MLTAFSSAERRHLHRVDDAEFEHVAPAVVARRPSPAFVFVSLLDAVDDDRAFEAARCRRSSRSAPRALRRAAGCRSARRRSSSSSASVSSAFCARMRATPPPGDDAFIDRGAGGAEGVFDACLLLLELDFGRGADLDDGNAAGQLREPLLQLLAVEVARRVVDLGLDLLDAGLDRLVGADALR